MIPINYSIAFKKSLTSSAVFLLRVSRLDTICIQVEIGISFRSVDPNLRAYPVLSCFAFSFFKKEFFLLHITVAIRCMNCTGFSEPALFNQNAKVSSHITML